MTDNIPQCVQRFVQEKLTKESRFALPPEHTNRRLSILPASLGGLFAEKGSHFLDRARRLTNAEPVSLFTMEAVLVDPSYAEIGEYDTAVIAMHLGNGVLYRVDFS